MYLVDLYLTVRLACHVEELSQREAARRFGLSRDTVKKMLRHSVPPGYRRSEPPKRPKLDPFTDIIDRILEADRTVHRKQRHTAKRIFERLRDEHGFTGGQTSSRVTSANGAVVCGRCSCRWYIRRGMRRGMRRRISASRMRSSLASSCEPISLS